MDLTQVEAQVEDLHEKLLTLFKNELSPEPHGAPIAMTVLTNALGSLISLYDPPVRFRILAGTMEILASQIKDDLTPETDQ